MNLASINFTELENETFRNSTDLIPFTDSSPSLIVFRLIPYFYTLAGVLLLLYLLSGGFQLMTSAGNPKAVEAGKAKITYAFLGFLIVFTSFWIVRIIGLLLGIDVISNLFPTN